MINFIRKYSEQTNKLFKFTNNVKMKRKALEQKTAENFEKMQHNMFKRNVFSCFLFWHFFEISKNHLFCSNVLRYMRFKWLNVSNSKNDDTQIYSKYNNRETWLRWLGEWTFSSLHLHPLEFHWTELDSWEIWHDCKLPHHCFSLSNIIFSKA